MPGPPLSQYSHPAQPYYVRKIDDVIPKVGGASHFSILDARTGYLQVELDDESSKLCTFSTPWGKYRWKRLPFTWTPDGLRADNLKIKAIRNMPFPQDPAELHTFMGKVNYLNRFSPVIAKTSVPLRQLMKKDTPFVWQPEHTKAFQNLNHIITEAPVLAYYNPEKDNVIQSDASQRGILCVLMRDGKPVCYASPSLSDT